MSRGGLIWGRNTALWMGVVQNGLALGVAFGVHLSGAQVAAVMAFSASLGALIAHQGAVSEIHKAEEVNGGGH